MAQEKQYLISFFATVKGSKIVTSEFKQIEQGIKRTSKAAKRGAITGGDFMKALKRVAVVVPVWFLFRRVFTGVIETIQNGIKFLVEWEHQMAQVRLVGQGTAEEYQRLSNELLNLAKSYGISTKFLGQGCFDKKTEILTDSGWKYFKDLTYKDKVLSMNPVDRNAEYKSIEKIISYKYRGTMYEYNSTIDFKVTPNHRFFYNKYNKIYEGEIKEFANKIKKFNVPSSFNWKGNIYSKFIEFKDFGSKKPLKINIKDFCEFLGWFISEGDVYKDILRKDSYRIKISQFKNKQYVNEIKKLLQRIGLSGNYSQSSKSFRFCNKALGKYLLDNCGKYSKNKKIPKEIKQLPPFLLKLLLKTLIKGDGHFYNIRNSVAYFTTSKQLADDIQEIAYKCGYYCSIKYKKNTKQYHLYISLRTKNKKIEISKIIKKDYNDYVYCVNVKPYHTIFVRRNGYAYWTLNSKLWAQQGKSIAEIIPLMRTTVKLSLLTGRTVAQSVEDLTAIMKNFNIEANETGQIVDKVTNVMLNHAITTDVLVDALKQAAPVATQFGVSFEKILGIITATHVATRSAGSRIGRAWRTIFTRMATTGRDAIQQIAKVPVFIDETGKATFKNTGILRNFGEVIDEIAISFNNLGSAQQAQLGRALAGIRRTTEFTSAMQQYDEGIRATLHALDAYGEGQRAVNILLDTARSKSEQLQGAWNEFVASLTDTGALKGVLDSLKGMIEHMTQLSAIMQGTEMRFAVGQVMKQQLDETTDRIDFQISKYRTMQQGVAQLISYLETRNRLEKIGTEEAAKKIKDLEDNIKLFTNVLGKYDELGETMKLPFDEMLVKLQEIQPQFEETIISKKAARQFAQRKNEMAVQIEDLFARMKKIGDEQVGLNNATSFQYKRIYKDIKNNLSVYTQLNELIEKQVDIERVIAGLREQASEIPGVSKEFNKQADALEDQLEVLKSIIKLTIEREKYRRNGFKQEKTALELQEKIKEGAISIVLLRKEQYDREVDRIKLLKETGHSELQIAKQILDFTQRNLDRYENIDQKLIDRLTHNVEILKTKQQIGQALDREHGLIKDMEAAGHTRLEIAIQELEIMKQREAGADVIYKKEQEIADLMKDQAVVIAQKLISHELELLKLKGATSRTILESKIALEDQFNLNQGTINQLDRQLALEKDITAEKLGQKRLSSDSLKIFEAYQRYGMRVATELAKWVTGMRDFDDLSENALKAAKRLFPTRLKETRVREFFEKEGVGIPIAEREQINLDETMNRYREVMNRSIENEEYMNRAREDYIKLFGRAPMFKYELEPARMAEYQRAAGLPQTYGGLPPEKEVRAQISQDIAVSFPQINIKVEADNIAKKATDAVISELRKEDSPLSKEIEDKIDNF